MHKYIIVGAGSAGCVLANRLSLKEKTLLIEAGRSDKLIDKFRIQMPSAMGLNLHNNRYNWNYKTSEQKNLNNRQIVYPRGKVLGGSSSINAMVYLRGNPQDYEMWKKMGNDKWGYSDVLPYFKKMETYQGGDHEYRGQNGPLHVTRPELKNPLYQAFIDSGIQAGFNYNDDINGRSQEGFGRFDMTVKDGIRNSTSRAYLDPIKNRENLKIITNVTTQRIIFDGKKAIGIEIEQNGSKNQIFGENIILSSGSIGSPMILQNSGVGRSEDLMNLNIDVVHDLQGVGYNLQDHLEVYVQHKCKQPITLYPYQLKFPHNYVKVGLQWFYNQTGICSSNHLEVGAFIKSSDKYEYANLQYHFLPAAIEDQGSSLGNFHGYQVHIGPMRESSRGFVKIQSRNMNDHPIIDPNYLDTNEDREEFIEAIKLTRKIFAQKAFEEFNDGEFYPGDAMQTDDQILAFIKERAESAYHPCGTCKMGQDKDAVVNQHGKVHGVQNLFVVDASIMPQILTANLNCPTIMIAEKMSDHILFETQ